MEEKNKILRDIPKVGQILEKSEMLVERYGRQQVVDMVRATVDLIREELIHDGPGSQPTTVEQIIKQVEERLHRQEALGLSPVINGTGVVLHTNLGRAVLPENVVHRLGQIAGRYSSLELDLATGKRGSRYIHVNRLLKKLTGAEASVVTNNNAAAVLLMLNTLAKGKEVIVSRGQLVEVGGGFRIPEVMAASGAQIREVGTTNKTYLRDYEGAITEDTGGILYVHPSNYRIEGFTHQARLEEMAQLCQEKGIPLLIDAGSGMLWPKEDPRFSGEHQLEDLVKLGDVICFSGDKLLGGPQSGIILGKRAYISQLQENHLLRALRVGKLTLIALEETLKIYQDPDRVKENIPLWKAIELTERELVRRGKLLKDGLQHIQEKGYGTVAMGQGFSVIGGGCLPSLKLPSIVVEIKLANFTPNEIEHQLRTGYPPIISRIDNGAVVIDVRTLLNDEEIKDVIDGVSKLIQEQRGIPVEQ